MTLVNRGRRNAIWLLCCLVLGCLQTGCGHQPGSDRIYGSLKVSLSSSGQPLTAGSVQLTNPTEGKSVAGLVNGQGIAELPEVEVGFYKVLVLPPTPEPGQPLPDNTALSKFSSKYQSIQNTPFEVTVTKGDNSVRFDLQ